jgi:predicted RNA binding protein YcfA (HicA-like mRNA interferase family)
MAKKIRELKAILKKAGFTCETGKGSHTKWRHPLREKPVVLSGKDGQDAKRYQEKEVEEALRDVKGEK